MYYSLYHNHKWARNLRQARSLWEAGQFEALYRGMDLPDGDVYPGLRVMAAYWVSVEHEMPLRLVMLLKGSGRPELRSDPQVLQLTQEYLERFLSDMQELVQLDGICPPERIQDLNKDCMETPTGWAEAMRGWQEASEAALAAGQFPAELFDQWLESCLRSVANYNRYLIQGAVTAARLVQEGGEAALQAAVDTSSEEFMWEISRRFFASVLPAAGFEDIGDLMELGLRGMYADQWYQSGEERQVGEATVKESILKNCELAGVYRAVAGWQGLPQFSLGYGICRYCEVHGLATMMISIPPMMSPGYRRLQSLGMEGEPCRFELTLTPADDMERILMVQEKVFGAVD